jgi:hypothetical protein
MRNCIFLKEKQNSRFTQYTQYINILILEITLMAVNSSLMFPDDIFIYIKNKIIGSTM